MHAKFRGQSSPSASFLQLYVGGKLQNAHVSAHSITDTELLGNISTVMGTIMYMDIDFGKYRSRRRTEGGWRFLACISLRFHGGGSTRPLLWP